MSYSQGYGFGGGGGSSFHDGYAEADGQQPYDDEADRTDVLKLVLYDLNSAIAPRDVRLMAIHAGECGFLPRGFSIAYRVFATTSLIMILNDPSSFNSPKRELTLPQKQTRKPSRSLTTTTRPSTTRSS